MRRSRQQAPFPQSSSMWFVPEDISMSKILKGITRALSPRRLRSGTIVPSDEGGTSTMMGGRPGVKRMGQQYEPTNGESTNMPLLWTYLVFYDLHKLAFTFHTLKDAASSTLFAPKNLLFFRGESTNILCYHFIKTCTNSFHTLKDVAGVVNILSIVCVS